MYVVEFKIVTKSDKSKRQTWSSKEVIGVRDPWKFFIKLFYNPLLNAKLTA